MLRKAGKGVPTASYYDMSRKKRVDDEQIADMFYIVQETERVTYGSNST